MSQHDYNIANGGGAAVRADINNALLAILSQNSGATAPTTTKPFMLWYDTANALIKMRNAADNAWIDYMNSSGQLVSPTATGLITALGGQIKFPASQNASADANTLDDYEEGTWTPTWGAASGSMTYNLQLGRYVKVGRFVTVTCHIQTTANNALTGNVFLSGLPFPSDSSAGNYVPGCVHAEKVSLAANAWIWTHIGPNSTTADLRYWVNAANAGYIQGSYLQATSDMMVSITYLTT
jgi:hypothetical protein